MKSALFGRQVWAHTCRQKSGVENKTDCFMSGGGPKNLVSPSHHGAALQLKTNELPLIQMQNQKNNELQEKT
jgi:hypothetical protein